MVSHKMLYGGYSRSIFVILILMMGSFLVLGQEAAPTLTSGSIAGIGSGIVKYGVWALVGILALVVFLGIVGGIIFWQYQRKRWYLGIEFKFITSNGQHIKSEWGKGNWDKNKGILWVKRTKMKKEPIKALDIREYLQGEKIITVLGAPGSWRPVLTHSYFTVIDEEGAEASVMKLKMDMREDTEWAIHTERGLKQAFTVQKLWDQIKDFVIVGSILLIALIGEVIRYSLYAKK